jgi:hypothetical protein
LSVILTKYIPHDSGYSSNNSENVSLSSLSPPPTVSGDISSPSSQVSPIALLLVQKAIGDKGYCSQDDFVFVTQMEPNLHWTEKEAEQTFRQLVAEGKLVEFEEGRFKSVV